MSTSGGADAGGADDAHHLLDADAIVVPVSTQGIDRTTVRSAEALPDVEQRAVAATREGMRVNIAYAILGGAGLSGAAAAAAAIAGASSANVVLNGVFTPLLGLAGTVVGFYFGGKDNTA